MLAVLWYRLPAVVYAAALYWASSKSRLPLPKWGLGFEDKAAHCLAFGLLAWHGDAVGDRVTVEQPRSVRCHRRRRARDGEPDRSAGTDVTL